MLSQEDTEGRLADNQFGYGSVHFEVTLKDSWYEVPTLSRLKGLIAEIQVRTAAQHIWAAASHTLQYKKEQHVPMPLRRSISRVASHLETVDLEFARVLNERMEYKAEIVESEDTLNIENLHFILDKKLPSKNKSDDEDYAGLYDELIKFSITQVHQLEVLIDKHLDSVLVEDRVQAIDVKKQADTGISLSALDTTVEGIVNGVYFTHERLIRSMLMNEYGDKYEQILGILDVRI